MQNRKTWPRYLCLKLERLIYYLGGEKCMVKKDAVAISAVTVVAPLLNPVYTAYFVVLTLSCMTNQAV